MDIQIGLKIPEDAEAIAWLRSAMQNITIPASQASNALAVNVWLTRLEERLSDYENTKRQIDAFDAEQEQSAA